MGDKSVTVDILMPAYNLERYIAQAIESVLMQKTTYSYRLLIGEDGSQDCTREIVQDYMRRFPDKISGILYEQNVGMRENYRTLLTSAIAKYVFILDGDDYWTDENLIQNHVDYLEEHKEDIAILCNSRSVNEFGEPDESLNVFPLFPEGYYTRKQACEFIIPGQMGGLCYRNLKYLMNDRQWAEFGICSFETDVKLFVTLGILGKVYCNPKIVMDHRRVINKGSSWSALTAGKDMSLYEYEGIRTGAVYLKNAFGCVCDVKLKLKGIRQRVLFNYIYAPSLMHKEVYQSFCRKGYLNRVDLERYHMRCKLGEWKRKMQKWDKK